MKKTIVLAFNPDTMTVSDLKAAAKTLRSLMFDYTTFKDNPEEFTLRFAQIADFYEPD